MPRTQPTPPQGAPQWALTYGDMMSLMLVFFIMLVALSELKQDEQFVRMSESIRTAFGHKTGGAVMPTIMDPTTSLIEKLDEIELHQRKTPDLSHTSDPGMDGRHPQVTRIRESLQFVVGGAITFEQGSTELNDAAVARLDQVITLIKGYRNKVELRGHAATAEGGDMSDLNALAFARANAVQAYMVSRGVEADRIRLVSCGDREPLVMRKYAEHELEPNRRVEVIVSEALTDDFSATSAN